MAFYLKGTHVPHHKNTAGMAPVQMPAPESITLPVQMHIGAPAVPVVKVGDHVNVGTLVAEQNGAVSSPVYSGISGTVSEISEIRLASGNTAPAITITSDGAMTIDESVTPPVVTNREELGQALKKSGIVGLGGAGFPTYVKFGGKSEIEQLVINGAECEPYITSDSVTMTENAEEIAYAIGILAKYFEIKNVIIGIEKNKPAAIDSMKNLSVEGTTVEVKVLPSIYPQGGEKVLVYHTTGKVIGEGKLPIDVGCVVCNCSTIAAIGKYLKTGMPLVERCITVDGGAVKEPKNVIVPIGTSIKDVFEFCGGFLGDPAKVLYGGPMMGIAVATMDAPILKNTNAILALDKKQATPPKTTACIRCGACTNHCPFGLDPAAFARAYAHRDLEALEKLGLGICMECGCCSYVCPAKRPLVQNNKLAKVALRAAKAKEAK